MIEAERKKEEQREFELKKCNNDKLASQLETQFGYQRSEAQQNITILMKRHKEELNRVPI